APSSPARAGPRRARRRRSMRPASRSAAIRSRSPARVRRSCSTDRSPPARFNVAGALNSKRSCRELPHVPSREVVKDEHPQPPARPPAPPAPPPPGAARPAPLPAAPPPGYGAKPPPIGLLTSGWRTAVTWAILTALLVGVLAEGVFFLGYFATPSSTRPSLIY